MQITYKSTKDIKAYEKNAKKHPKEQVEYIANSITEFGFKIPIIIDSNNVIVAGHGRLLAAKKLGLKEVPCIIADDLTPEQIKAFRLADNKVAESDWDNDLLGEELLDLKDLFNMEQFGFEEADFNIEDDDVEAEEDYYEPELPKNPKAKRGDIYQLGNHRLMCGDCTDEADVEKLTGGEEMDM